VRSEKHKKGKGKSEMGKGWRKVQYGGRSRLLPSPLLLTSHISLFTELKNNGEKI